MIEPLQLVWMASLVVAAFVLLVLWEVHRINYRRENEEMFGTEAFDEKVKAFEFTDKEKRTLEKMIRASSFENKDAVINSSVHFEAAVTNFYDFRDVFTIRDETVDAVESIRKKMDFTASNPLTQVCSTRQFNVGDRIDLILDSGRVFKRSEIVWRKEKEWAITYDGSCGPVGDFVGQEVLVRWTRPDDAVYSTYLDVRSCLPDQLILPHSSNLEKKQLRRWVRETVAFPVVATLPDGSTCEGRLFDLSAGGIMIGLPVDCSSGEHVRIRFVLPSFGEEDVEIEILRNLGHKRSEFPEYNCLTASFSGSFGWTQERVLQYLFEANKAKKEAAKKAKIA
ncbi:MAG: PilZ domain-containing protein [Fibrobacter sp.]|nr:PilZ domain-containing protein [Fibrobacter sp.]